MVSPSKFLKRIALYLTDKKQKKNNNPQDKITVCLNPYILVLSRQAINVLSKGKDGFVLMVESGRIDHAHHQNQVIVK